MIFIGLCVSAVFVVGGDTQALTAIVNFFSLHIHPP